MQSQPKEEKKVCDSLSPPPASSQKIATNDSAAAAECDRLAFSFTAVYNTYTAMVLHDMKHMMLFGAAVAMLRCYVCKKNVLHSARRRMRTAARKHACFYIFLHAGIYCGLLHTSSDNHKFWNSHKNRILDFMMTQLLVYVY